MTSVKVKPKMRKLCAIIYEQPAPCAGCKDYKECPLTPKQKQQIMGVVRSDLMSMYAWMEPWQKSQLKDEIMVGASE